MLDIMKKAKKSTSSQEIEELIEQVEEYTESCRDEHLAAQDKRRKLIDELQSQRDELVRRLEEDYEGLAGGLDDLLADLVEFEARVRVADHQLKEMGCSKSIQHPLDVLRQRRRAEDSRNWPDSLRTRITDCGEIYRLGEPGRHWPR